MTTFLTTSGGVKMGNVVSNIVQLNRGRVFNLTDAREVLPIMYRITEKVSEKVKALMHQLESSSSLPAAKSLEIEAEIDQLVLEWHKKVEMLGARPKGMWLADFDSGEGYFCWKYPEKDIYYWHGYSDGFSRRVAINEQSSNRTNQSEVR